MDKGVIQILALEAGREINEITEITSSLGFIPRVSDLGAYLKCDNRHKSGILEPCIKLLVMGRELSPVAVKSLRAELGLCNVVLGRPEWFDDCPAVYLMAADYCTLPCSGAELSRRIDRSCLLLSQLDLQADHTALEMNMVGQAPTFLAAMAGIRRFARINAPTLILGETGTGKELAARAVHYSGIHRNGPFQAINCGAMPDHLVENELFGHARGAYTDAHTAQEGLVALADGGTLFLDEVDALSLKAQAALLRFLQDGSYRELGSGREKRVRVRVISASNQNLANLVKKNLFRKDLIYRLNTLTLMLPSLRQRREDIDLLAQYFLHQCELNYEQGRKVFHPAVVEKMRHHRWPGNVRELENYVQRAYLSTDSLLICQEPEELDLAAVQMEAAPAVSADNGAGQLPELRFAEAKRLAVEKFESEYVASLMVRAGGNVSSAARMAGKERRCFGRLIKKYGIAH